MVAEEGARASNHHRSEDEEKISQNMKTLSNMQAVSPQLRQEVLRVGKLENVLLGQRIRNAQGCDPC